MTTTRTHDALLDAEQQLTDLFAVLDATCVPVPVPDEFNKRRQAVSDLFEMTDRSTKAAIIGSDVGSYAIHDATIGDDATWRVYLLAGGGGLLIMTATPQTRTKVVSDGSGGFHQVTEYSRNPNTGQPWLTYDPVGIVPEVALTEYDPETLLSRLIMISTFIRQERRAEAKRSGTTSTRTMTTGDEDEELQEVSSILAATVNSILNPRPKVTSRTRRKATNTPEPTGFDRTEDDEIAPGEEF